MKKVRGYHLLFGAAALMVLGYAINLYVDYQQYKVSFTSAPFWLWMMVDAVIWLIPALIAVVAGFVAKRKLFKKENTK